MLEKISDVLVFVMKIISIAICGFIAVFAFLFTQRHGIEELGEYVCTAPLYEKLDYVFLNVMVVGIVLVLFFYLKKKEALLEKIEKYLLLVDFVVIALFSIYWISNSHAPVYDQANLLQAASSCLQGDYSYFQKGAYLNLYPQQFGLVSWYQILLIIFKGNGLRAIRYTNAMFAMGSFGMVYLCVKELRVGIAGRVMTLLSPAMFLPLLFYTSFVYGEVPSIFFMLLFGYEILKIYNGSKRKCDMALLVLAGWGMVLTRINSLIMLIAFVGVAIVYFMVKKNKMLLVLSLVIAMSCFVPIKGIEHYYERVSGYEVDGGMPHMLWIAMGSRDSASKPGWFDNYPSSTYSFYGFDKEKAVEDAKTKILDNLEYHAQNPMEGISFYKRKICTQWNDPTYNAMHYGLRVDFENVKDESTDFYKWLLAERNGWITFLSVVQFVVYAGMLFYALGKHKALSIHEDIFLITIIGGFLFSIMWEADSRYILPYYVLMLPYVFKGWSQALDFLMRRKK